VLILTRWSPSDLSFLLTLPTLLPDFPRSSSFLRMEAQRSTLGGSRVKMPLKEPSDRTKILGTMVKGRVLLLFEYHLSKICVGEDIETTDQELLELVIRD
jgi:hypothetical protein